MPPHRCPLPFLLPLEQRNTLGPNPTPKQREEDAKRKADWLREILTQLRLGSAGHPNILGAYTIVFARRNGFFEVGMVMPKADGTLESLINEHR